MKAYIINLKTSIERKQYIEQLLSPYQDFMNVHFVEAVDGRGLSEKQLSEIWNQKETYKTYGRYMKGGEIGCALSHRKCYEEILNNGDDVALILEDDVKFQNVDVRSKVLSVEKFVRTNRPVVVLLSGDYWFTLIRQIDNNICLANIREAMGAIAYVVNQSAAKILLSADKEFLADDWYNLKKGGLALYALHPHFVDTTDLGTEISVDGYAGTIRKNLSLFRKCHSYYRAVIRRILGEFGNFERRIS